MSKPVGQVTSINIALLDRELIRSALDKVHALPTTLSDEDAVRRILRIRNSLERDLKNRRDPRVQAAHGLRRAFLLSISFATVVSALGIWRVVDRFSTSLGLFDQPVPFLTLFTLLFLVSWFPLLPAALRARKQMKQSLKRSQIDISTELRAFDVAMVRGLLKEDGAG